MDPMVTAMCIQLRNVRSLAKKVFGSIFMGMVVAIAGFFGAARRVNHEPSQPLFRREASGPRPAFQGNGLIAIMHISHPKTTTARQSKVYTPILIILLPCCADAWDVSYEEHASSCGAQKAYLVRLRDRAAAAASAPRPEAGAAAPPPPSLNSENV